MEVTAEIGFSVATGKNLVHDLGMLDVGMTGSIHLMVFWKKWSAMQNG